MQILFLCLLHVLAILIHSLPINSEKEVTFDINEDGTLQNNSATPNCGSGKKLSLKSYYYTTTECKYGGSLCPRKEHPFSLKAKVLLHDMCSYKDECVNLSFPVKSDLQKYNPKGVLITYECLDQQKKFCDICYQNKTIVKGTINLMATDNVRYFTQCKCELTSENRSNISITLKDLRLNAYDSFERRCSGAVLEINQTKIICDENKTDFGCEFNEIMEPPTSSVTIIFTPKDEEEKFEMVWLALNIKGSAKMVCEGKQKQSNSASDITSISATDIPPNKSDKTREALSDIPGSIYTIGIGVPVLVIVLSVVVISLIYTRAKRKNTHGNTPETGCGNLLEEMPYDTCNTHRRTERETC